ncbi:uncharacterized protein TNIN_113591 [Trichonephila inaurata madagascariensis]|uniref:Uncharacterized protein n=1 Tax=Trichonephila inaurata madagascariensis TaxID=2747483 RepID=A0A8X7CB26_9ARAC|nr:uncharacterized protein TNIN_113591 [Trichonephila inaurata madagascariensis]
MGSILLPHKFFSRTVILFNRTQKYFSCSIYRNASSCSKITCSPLFINHHLLRKNSPSLISSRTFWEAFPLVRPLFHVKDRLDPENHELIYRCKLFFYAFYGQSFSQLAFSVQIGACLYMLYDTFIGKGVISLATHMGPFQITYDFISLSVLAVLTLQNVLLYTSAQKVLLRIYYKKDTDEYVFISLSFNPLNSRQIICKPGELKDMNIQNLKAMLTGNHNIGDRKYFLNRSCFKNDKHYVKLVYGENI